MIVESHWRLIKHDFLHRFSRPRIDFVTWILIKFVFPAAKRKMHAILEGDHRVAIASWRKCFKKEWTVLSQKHVDPASIHRYHTNANAWVCSCLAFLVSRFLVCKHLIFCCHPVEGFEFFDDVRRQRTQPFWTLRLLVVKDEYQALPGLVAAGAAAVPDVEEAVVAEGSGAGSVILYNDEQSGEEQEVEQGGSFLEKMERLVEMVRDQDAKGSRVWLHHAEAGMHQTLRLQADTER